MKYRKALGIIILILLFCVLLQNYSNFNLKALAKEPKSYLELTGRFSEAGKHGYYVRHCVTDRILGKVPAELQSIPFEISNGISPENTEQRQSSFENIFKNKVWIAKEERKNENQASGRGSTLYYAQDVIAALHSIITRLKRELGVDRIRLLDIPCGDMVWMSRFLKTRDDVLYTGIDIVPDLISRHQENYDDQSNWTFRVQDIVREGLNESYDLILCRMMLQHLFSHDAMTVIKHFSESGSRNLLTTSFNRINKNHELSPKNTRFRMLNLEIPPFSLTPPNCVLRDGENGETHFLGMWELPVRRAKLCNSTVSFGIPGLGPDFFSCTKWSS